MIRVDMAGCQMSKTWTRVVYCSIYYDGLGIRATVVSVSFVVSGILNPNDEGLGCRIL